ncbi:MAG: 3-dehydroquinate synthase II [Candidatus Lokiarchaeota archaeon]|nr:3-dehydroquinate synthase II [Candidatus Lokiarchaeota archaeon]
MKEKRVIFEVTGSWAAAKPVYVEAITAGFTTFVVREAGDARNLRGLGKVEIISPLPEAEPDYLLLDAVPSSPGKPQLDAFFSSPLKKCVHLSLGSKGDEELVVDIAGKGAGMVIVDATDWRVIPLENLIAELQKRSTLLAGHVEGVDEARLFFETLQVGVDGVFHVIDAAGGKAAGFDFGPWKRLVSSTESIPIGTATITRIEDVGSGDRVCVDTISMLEQGEGMLVGNHARGFFLVHGEVSDTEFVNARPFRVNAGAVHSYTLRAGNKTAYLSELKAGEPVMVVDWKGHTRVTRVGRAKIETRPMLLVEGEVGGETISAVLQNAETICLVDETGNQRSISKLKVGDKVKAFVTGEKGRHFGKNIEEKVIEK